MAIVLSLLAWPTSQTFLTFGKDFTNGLDYYMCGLATTQAILAHPFFELDSKQDSIRKPSVKQAKKLTKLNDFAHFFYLLLLWSNCQK